MNKDIYIQKNGIYLQKNPTWHIEDSPWKAKQVKTILNSNSLVPKTIAEVGCGAGEILNQLHLQMPRDTVFVGYDISIDAISLAKQREKERLSYRHEDFLKSKERFDLLLLMDVFEHVEDYMGFLRSCKKSATNYIFHIPLDLTVQSVMRNQLLNSRNKLGHLHYFTKETAIATLVDSGYEIIDYFYTTWSFELPSLSFKSKLVLLPRKLLFKLNKDLAVRILGGCSLLVLAK